MMRAICVSLLVLVASSISVAAQEAVYLIRHGEKELTGEEPELTPEGRQRAAHWAEMLQHVGLDAIITSDALRTRQTGQIVAEALGLQYSTLPRGDIAGLVDVLEFDHEDDTVLVVAHAETIPRILESFGVPEDVSIEQSEFSSLFILIRPTSTELSVIRLLMP
ncbi:phosphoglycerate mutase family protein [Ostreiculturibacter nitratireducens]|uniref:SixA phosphatase family protein n=1 Tax=Ostreiculturibacter nitratireducens TaxID=3075226 RepID=UPI0031B60E21